MSNIEKDLENQIAEITSAIQSGDLSPTDGHLVLKEIESALKALNLAKKEVLVQKLVTALTIAKSLS